MSKGHNAFDLAERFARSVVGYDTSGSAMHVSVKKAMEVVSDCRLMRRIRRANLHQRPREVGSGAGV
jgi:hypothetical protein